MPEIAEVRVVAKTLKKSLIGKKIDRVNDAIYPRIIQSDIDEFKSTLAGRTIEDIRTCGKWLIFDLGEYSFLSHLRMEGKYFYVPRDKEIEKHTHIIFELDDGMDLRYNDVRKFGRMLLVKTREISECEAIHKLGFEPDDDRLSAEYLKEKFKNKEQAIKTTLLDQTIINGLGNIYANEVLFAAGINPFRKTKTITVEEMKKIIEEGKRIIKKSTEVGGCTIRSYTSSLGVIGHYQDYLKVHGKKDEPCSKCASPIKKDRIDGRSVYYCPKCQK